jgi:hypothetical protein
MMNGNGHQPQPAVQGQQQPMATGEDALVKFMIETLKRPMLEHLKNGWKGDSLAEWMDDGGFADYIKPLQNFQHSQLPGLQGAAALFQAMHHPMIWGEVAHREQQLRQFLQEFCAWKDEDDNTVEGETEPVQQGGDSSHEFGDQQ